MLKKAHICPTDFRTDDGYEKWRRNRLAKFTSSEIHYLTYPTGLTEGSLSYIRRKVGEELTGQPARPDFETDATRHGLLHEATAIRKFGIKMGLEFVVVQQLISPPDSRFGGTPDALIVVRESPDQTEYEVSADFRCVHQPVRMRYASAIEKGKAGILLASAGSNGAVRRHAGAFRDLPSGLQGREPQKHCLPSARSRGGQGRQENLSDP